MMIKVNGSYIGLSEDPTMVRQAKTPDLLGTAGDFSYQFDAQNTSEIRRLLGLNSIYTEQFNVDAELVNDDGVGIYSGILNVEGIEKYVIHCSFLAGNSDWFSIVRDKKVYDIPVMFTDQYKELRYLVASNGHPITPTSLLTDNWANTEGIVFPFVDAGKLRNWGTKFLWTEDFLPWTFIKHIVKAIFQSNGLKAEGDLFSDGLYNNLIVTTQFTNDVSLPFFEGLSMFVGKSTNQSINTSPSVITFDLVDFPYNVGSYNSWNGTDTYTVPISFLGYLSVDFDFSGSVTYDIEMLVNGVVESNITGTGAEVTATFRDIGAGIYRPTKYPFNQGDVIQVRASISSGSTNILAGSTLKMEVDSLRHWYPQYMVGGMTQGDFIKSVFTMFNVVSSFDNITRTVTCSLFKNVLNNTVDLSEYLDSYSIDTIEVLQDLAAQMIFKHQESTTEIAEDYNKTTPVPFGAALIEPNNRMLADVKEIETEFTAGMDYYNNLFRTSLIDMGAITLEPSGEVKDFGSVTDDSGDPVFHTVDQDGNPENHGFQDMDVVLITGTANGEYLGMGYVQAGPPFGLGADEFKIRRADFVSDTTGHYQRVSLSTSTNSDNVYVAVYVPEGPVSNFSKFDEITYGTTQYDELPWAYFLKEAYGVPFDNLLLSPAFGQIESYTQFPLIDNYYALYRSSIENPVKVKTTMMLPEVVYRNLRFDQAVVLKTEDFTGSFFIQKIEGYVGSHKPCTVELFRLT
jgi:hypothetical protein